MCVWNRCKHKAVLTCRYMNLTFTCQTWHIQYFVITGGWINWCFVILLFWFSWKIVPPRIKTRQSTAILTFFITMKLHNVHINLFQEMKKILLYNYMTFFLRYSKSFGHDNYDITRQKPDITWNAFTIKWRHEETLI